MKITKIMLTSLVAFAFSSPLSAFEAGVFVCDKAIFGFIITYTLKDNGRMITSTGITTERGNWFDYGDEAVWYVESNWEIKEVSMTEEKGRYAVRYSKGSLNIAEYCTRQ